jgi:hypothetical protein
MMMLVSWDMQGSWETWASPEGAGLPMMVVVSWEMQSSVMGDAGLIGNFGLIEDAGLPMMVLFSREMQGSVMGMQTHWEIRTH